jgi:hypothetical protein
MGIEAGSSTYYQAKRGIVQDGLVLHLDAGVKESYGGAGNTWYDLSGNNNNGTLTNGPAYNKSNGGNILFDGTNDGFSTANTASQMGVSETSFSVFMFIRRSVPTINSSQGYAGFGSNGAKAIIMSTTNFFVVFDYSNGSQTPGTTILTGATTSYNQWVSLCFTVDNGYVRGYGNGNFSYARDLGTLESISPSVFTIAGGYGYYRYQGAVGVCCLYNKKLSTNEVSQNHNVLRHRFGI